MEYGLCTELTFAVGAFIGSYTFPQIPDCDGRLWPLRLEDGTSLAHVPVATR